MANELNPLTTLVPSEDYEQTKLALSHFNSTSVDPNSSHTFDQTNRSSLADIRKIIEKASEAGKIERDEYLGVVIDIVEEQEINSKRIIKKIYVDVPGVNFENITHPDQFSKEDIDLVRLEHKAFYAVSEKLLETELPHYNDIVRIKIPKNYFNSYVVNPYDKKYLGIFLKSTSVIPSTDSSTVPKAESNLQLLKDKVTDFFFGNSTNTTAPDAVPPIAKKDKTDQRIATLDYRFQSIIRNFVTQARAAGYRIVVASATRSIEEQRATYAQGRTAPGPIVTQAKEGDSPHNFGLAIDFAFANSDGQPTWPNDAPWGEVAKIGKNLGLEWGGDFKKFKDRPHLESKNWRQARASWVASGKSNYAIPTLPPRATTADVNAANTSESQPRVNATTQNTGGNTTGTNASLPVNRPKMLLVDFDVDQSTGIRTVTKLGSRKIKIREDIRSDLLKIKDTLNKYNVPLSCESFDIKLDNDFVSLLGKVGLEIRLNKNSALSLENNLDIDDYFVGPDYTQPLGNGYKLIVYGNIKRNVIYPTEKYTPKKQIIEVYDAAEIENKIPKTKKILKTVINLTEIFKDFGFINVLPSQDFFLQGVLSKSNWNVFQKSLNFPIGYSYKELLNTVYQNRGEPIWRLPDLKWDGNKFI